MEKKQKEALVSSKKKPLPPHSSVTDKYNVEEIINELQRRQALSKNDLLNIIEESSNILKNEPTLLKLQSPLIIVGDIHGQFYDLISLFQRFGYPPQAKYLFLGDYVDRGRFCIEVITLILVLKINYPDSIHLLRGNHEGRVMTSSFNFRTECEAKYQIGIYQRFIDLFMQFPLCAHIDQKYFAVHGGISPNIKTLDEIDKINRFLEIPEQGVLCDLLWSDPTDQTSDTWVGNKNRIQTSRFLSINQLRMIIRGHEVQMKGYKYQMGPGNQPLTLTIFSAPRYCDSYRNKGAVAVLNGKNIVVQSFKQVEHPFVLSNYLNAFQLSFPVLAAGATRLFAHMLKNKKLKKTMKHLGNDNTLEQVESIEGVFEKNADMVQMMLQNVSNENSTELRDPDSGIAESLSQFFMMKCQIQERMPIIFGPKRVEFVKVHVSHADEEDPTQ